MPATTLHATAGRGFDRPSQARIVATTKELRQLFGIVMRLVVDVGFLPAPTIY